MKSLRILTTTHTANPGACIFTYSLERLLARLLPEFEVCTLDYVPRNRYYYELVRAFKPQHHSLTHNLGRYLQVERFQRENLHLEKPRQLYPTGYEAMTRFLIEKSYDVLVTGMVVWDITDVPYLPRFPSIYWLSEKIPAVKIAYAVSGHRSKEALVKKNTAEIQRILSSYALIGVRDQLTWEIVLESKADQGVPVFRVPDPAFLFEAQPTRIGDLLARRGIRLDEPTIGILFYGKPDLSRQLCSAYRSRGFQTVALSMYNPYADVNLGDQITPLEWAESFKYLSFCVTDRFHGTVFCLKNNIPFISIEPYAPATIKNSKILSLLDEFELRECYIDVLQDGFKFEQFLERAEDLRLGWASNHSPRVEAKLEEVHRRSVDFARQIQTVIR